VREPGLKWPKEKVFFQRVKLVRIKFDEYECVHKHINVGL